MKIWNINYFYLSEMGSLYNKDRQHEIQTGVGFVCLFVPGLGGEGRSEEGSGQKAAVRSKKKCPYF